MIKVQKLKPKRTFNRKKEFATHHQYKKYLREDFNNRCGYCDTLDYYLGGSRGSQIDHFKPLKFFPELETTYSNLVYSCSYCNRAKWDKWENIDGFVDPCDDEYDVHLYRQNNGKLDYNTPRGKYIHSELNFILKRHELLWMLEKLKNQRKKLSGIIEKIDSNDEKELEIFRAFLEVHKKVEIYNNLYFQEI